RLVALVDHLADAHGLGLECFDGFWGWYIFAAFTHGREALALSEIAGELAFLDFAAPRRLDGAGRPLLKAADSLRQESSPAEAALLTVADDVDACLGLLLDHLGDGGAHPRCESFLVERGAASQAVVPHFPEGL